MRSSWFLSIGDKEVEMTMKSIEGLGHEGQQKRSGFPSSVIMVKCVLRVWDQLGDGVRLGEM